MKPALPKNKYYLLIAILCITALNAIGQKNTKPIRTTLNLTGGINLPQTSINGLPGFAVSGSLIYNPIPLIGIMPEISVGTMSGRGLLKTTERDVVFRNEVFSFSSQYFSYGVAGVLNLQRVFTTRKPTTPWVPYLIFGASYMNTSTTREIKSLGLTNSYDFTYYSNNIGAMVRIKMSREFDMLLLGRYHITQTYFMDAIPLTNKFDSFISFHAGLSYKIGSSNLKREYIDWRNVQRVGRGFGSGKCPRFF